MCRCARLPERTAQNCSKVRQWARPEVDDLSVDHLQRSKRPPVGHEDSERLRFMLATIKQWAELIQAILVIIGVPIGLYQYAHAVQKEQRDRQELIYNSLDEKFLQYQ